MMTEAPTEADQTPDAATAFIRPYRLDDGAGFSCVCMALPAWSQDFDGDRPWEATLADAIKSPPIPGQVDLVVVAGEFLGTPVAMLLRVAQGYERDPRTVRALVEARPPGLRHDIEMLAGVPLDDPNRPAADPDFHFYLADDQAVLFSSHAVRIGVARTLGRSWGTGYSLDDLRTAADRFLANSLLATEATLALGAGRDARSVMTRTDCISARAFHTLAGPFGRGSRWLDLCLRHPLMVAVILKALSSPATGRNAFDGVDESGTDTALAERALAWCAGRGSIGVHPDKLADVPAEHRLRVAAAVLDAARTIPEIQAGSRLSHPTPTAPMPAVFLFAGLCRVPRDWLPRTAHDWLCALAVTAVAWVLRSKGVPPSHSLRHVGSDWARTCRLIARSTDAPRIRRLGAGERLLLWDTRRANFGLPTCFIPDDGCTRPVADMFHAFATTVVAPAIANATLDPGSDLADAFRPNRDPQAATLLCADKGVAAICELATRWHVRAARMDAAIRAISPETATLEWKPGIPPFTTTIGSRTISVVPLTSESALIAEGGNRDDADGLAGLDHCVGGPSYVARCLRGEVRIVSIRATDADGRTVRLSTAEIAVNPVRSGGLAFSILQHQGRRNTTPPPDAADALAMYVARLDNPDHAAFGVAPRDLDPDRDALTRHATRLCGYDMRDPANIEKALRIWEPLLPRPLRGLTLAEFVDRIPGMRRSTATPPPSTRTRQDHPEETRPDAEYTMPPAPRPA